MKTLLSILLLSSSALAVTISGHVDQPFILRTEVALLVDNGGPELIPHYASVSALGYFECAGIPKDVKVWVYPASPFFEYTPTLRGIFVGDEDITNADFVGAVPVTGFNLHLLRPPRASRTIPAASF